jgi:hypothetical protein
MSGMSGSSRLSRKASRANVKNNEEDVEESGPITSGKNNYVRMIFAFHYLISLYSDSNLAMKLGAEDMLLYIKL